MPYLHSRSPLSTLSSAPSPPSLHLLSPLHHSLLPPSPLPPPRSTPRPYDRRPHPRARVEHRRARRRRRASVATRARAHRQLPCLPAPRRGRPPSRPTRAIARHSPHSLGPCTSPPPAGSVIRSHHAAAPGIEDQRGGQRDVCRAIAMRVTPARLGPGAPVSARLPPRGAAPSSRTRCSHLCQRAAGRRPLAFTRPSPSDLAGVQSPAAALPAPTLYDPSPLIPPLLRHPAAIVAAPSRDTPTPPLRRAGSLTLPCIARVERRSTVLRLSRSRRQQAGAALAIRSALAARRSPLSITDFHPSLVPPPALYMASSHRLTPIATSSAVASACAIASRAGWTAGRRRTRSTIPDAQRARCATLFAIRRCTRYDGAPRVCRSAHLLDRADRQVDLHPAVS